MAYLINLRIRTKANNTGGESCVFGLNVNNWGGFCFVIHHDARFQDCEQEYKTENVMNLM